MAEELDNTLTEELDDQDHAASHPDADGDGDGNPDASDEAPNQSAATLPPELAEKIDRLARNHEEALARLRNNPTPQNERAAEKVKGQLEKLLETEDLDLDTTKAIKAVAGEALDQQRRSGESQRQYEARLAMQDQQIAALNERLFRSEFERSHPDLDYDSLLKKASADEDLKEAYEEAQRTGALGLFNRLWNAKWNATVQEAEAALKTKGDGTPKVKKTPAGTAPLAGRSGQGSRDVKKLTAAQILYGKRN